MNDDFRLQLTLDGEGVLGELLETVRTGGVRREASDALGDRVAVSRDEERLWIYAASAEDARAAGEAIVPLAEHHGLRIVERTTVERWHPEEERWEDASVPLPETKAEHEIEHARHVRHERHHSERSGVPEWEVLVTLPDEGIAQRWVGQLEAGGMEHLVRRGRHVMAGAPSEDDARDLADLLRTEAPEGAKLEVQGNGQSWWSTLHPFAVFGGLGG